MARRLAVPSLIVAVALGAATVAFPITSVFAQAGEMDAKGEAEAREALTLYKQGLYEDAAKIFAKLSVDYPEMLIFERNLGACFYYLRKPGPAVSNLRHYLSRKRDIAPDDKEVVERWIAEMEKLREQAAVNVPPSVTPQPASAPDVAFVPGTEGRLDPLLPTAGTSYPTAPHPAAPAQTFQPSQAQYQLLAPTPIAGPSAPVRVSAPTEPAPLALDLSSRPAEVREESSPFYKTWWFWTGAVVVLGGAVTTYVLLAHRGTENACSGGSIPCDAIK